MTMPQLAPLIASMFREAAYDSTPAKADDLVRSGGVLSCEVRHGSLGGAVQLTGLVRASQGKPYEAFVTLDLTDNDVVDYGCTCPVGQRDAGMCKHAIALGLHYYLNERLGSTTLPCPDKLPNEQVSSPQITRLLAAESSHKPQRPRRISQVGTVEPAELDVALTAVGTAEDRSWLLGLQVRRGPHAHEVADIGALVRACQAGAELAHGPRLSFAHTREAFTEQAWRIIGLAGRIVRSQQAFLAAGERRRGAEGTRVARRLPLSADEVVELLDILQPGTAASRATVAAINDRAPQPNQLPGCPIGSPTARTPQTMPPLAPTGAPDALISHAAGPLAPHVAARITYAQAGLPARTLRVAAGDPQVRAVVKSGPHGSHLLVLPAELDCILAEGTLYLLDGETAWRCTPEFSAQAGTLFSQLVPAAGHLRIAARDLAAFCRTALPALRACCSLEVPEGFEKLAPPEPHMSFRIGLDDGEVSCDARVSYGDTTLPLGTSARPGQPPRDLAAEYHALNVAESYFPTTSGELRFDEGDDELLYLLLTDGLRELAALGEVLLSERLRPLRARSAPPLRVRATMKSGLLDVAVGASGLSTPDLLAYLDAHKRRQRYVRLSNGDVMRLGDDLRALDDLAHGLGVTTRELAHGAKGLPASRVLFVDTLLKRAGAPRLDRSESFQEVVRAFETFSDADIAMPASLAGTLRPYQAEGVRWLGTLERFGCGGVLADDMGLGKTLQVIAHLLARKEAGEQGPTLVVTPASLVYNWMAELGRFAPQISAAAVVGDAAARRRLIGEAASHDVLVTSYDLMKRDIETHVGQSYRRVVLDEAQHIKNADTLVAKCARCLPAQARLALTGTPIENKLGELWSIFEFLMPGMLGSRDAFVKRFDSPVTGGATAATQQLQCLVAPFVLRRMKADVLADLPEKTESVVLARMSGEQEKLYRATEERLALQIRHEMPSSLGRKKLKVLAELTRLRQICCDPRLCVEGWHGGSAKLDMCAELVRCAVDGGHRVLVFSQFASMLGLIAERLRAEGVGGREGAGAGHDGVLTLTGATNKEERARLTEAFQVGEASVFLISLKAGGTGLNLTAADVVIHYDPWWNLAAQSQATDRAYRIGQGSPVSVFRLIAQGTVEERIAQMQQRKQDLAEAVLSGDAVTSAALTSADVLALLGAQEG